MRFTDLLMTGMRWNQGCQVFRGFLALSGAVVIPLHGGEQGIQSDFGNPLPSLKKQPPAQEGLQSVRMASLGEEKAQ